MKRIAFNTENYNEYYYFNEEHIVCLGSDLNMLYVSIMDNNKKELDRRWYNSITMEQVEKIASQMLYDLGCNGEIREYELAKGKTCFYNIDSDNIQFPINITYYSVTPNGNSIHMKERINCRDEYLEALKRHRENNETLTPNWSVYFKDISDNISSINDHVEGASSQLEYLSDTLIELFHISDKGFKNDFVEQLKEAYEMNIYLLDKIGELKSKLPSDLHLVYPDK